MFGQAQCCRSQLAGLTFMAEQVLRFVGGSGYPRIILKGDGEPSMRMLSEGSRLWLGFHTVGVEWPS